MANDLALAIQEAGAAEYPNEACGVVISKGNKQLVIACKNTAEDPRLHFVIDMGDYIKAADQGEVIGIWHTHPELPPQPSDADKAGCENTEIPWYIVGVYKDEAVGFRFSDLEVVRPSGFQMPYVGRPYSYGAFDCYSIVRDFYKREYGIKIGDYPRVVNFAEKGMNFFGENWAKEGFVQIVDEEPQPGDVFLIQSTSCGFPSHVAIYLGDETILHHMHGRLSKRDVYGGYWLKHTTHHLRHKSRC